MAARDRFQNLPDRLICDHILTKLPLNEAIRCSVVSRRWKRFWTLLPALSFTDKFFNSIESAIDEKRRRKTSQRRVSQIELVGNTVGSIIDNILLLHSESIEVFEFRNTYWCRDKIRQWILSVASKGVTKVTLEEKSRCDCGCHPMEVPSALFSCDKLVYLSLKGFDLPLKPAHFGGLQFLEVFHIENVKLNEVAFELLINLYPRLETMSVLCCKVIKNLKLDSKSLKTLQLKDLELNSSSSIIVNCPQLTELKLKVSNDFYESYDYYESSDYYQSKPKVSIIVNCPQLTKLELKACNYFETKLEGNCPLLVHLATTNSQVLHGIPILESFRKLSLQNTDGVNILQKFPNIEELCISSFCLDGSRQALEVKESKLKKLHILGNSLENIGVLCHLLRRTPSLETVTISLEARFSSVDDLRFVNGLLSAMSPSAKVILSQPLATCPNCEVLLTEMHSKNYFYDSDESF